MNIWQLQDAYIARLESLAPAGVEIVGTFDATDWTADDSPRVGAQVVFDGLQPADETGRSALLSVRYSVHTFLDTKRASGAEMTAAADTVIAALQAAIGWEVLPGLCSNLIGGQQTGYDGRIARVSIAFTIPVPMRGAA